ncbi:MAG: hypothetical protein J2P31_09605, partial [Blastocatellia bacterium]|nr:hypothetical protein [Blastocatellia bacterium]
MQEETKTKLISVEDAAAALDMKRDYGYSRIAGNEGSTNLRDYWRIIRRRLWIPLSAVTVVLTLATIYNLRLPSIYQGVSKIEIDREDRVLELKDTQINMGASDDSQYFNTQLKIIESPRIAYLVAKSLDLEHNSEFLPGKSHPLDSNQEDIEQSNGESDEQAEMHRLEPFIDSLMDNVDVKAVRDTRLVEISYNHRVPDLAAKIADTWADAFRKNNLDQRYHENKEAGAFLEKSIADSKLKLKEAEERLLNYRKANEIIDFGDKDNTVITRLGALNAQLLEAENERKNAQRIYELSRSMPDVSALPEIQKDELIMDLNKKITDLRQTREQLLVEFTPEWPDVKKISNQLEQAEGELRAAHQRILTTIENNYKIAVQREDSLRQAFEEQRKATMQQNEGAIVAKIYQQEVDINRQMFERLLETQQGIEVSGPLLKSNIRIREYSQEPRSPVAPKRVQNILLSGLLALVGGIGFVLFLDYINNKIESVDDIDRYLRLPTLGVIPTIESGSKARRLLTSGSGDGKALAPFAGDSVILTQVEANSSLAESYRQLRTALLLSAAGHAPRTLLITSSQPAEGKTTTSVNTAIS